MQFFIINNNANFIIFENKKYDIIYLKLMKEDKNEE